jgi:hypothetical protein
MKCAVHPEVDATGFCRNCGKALCPACTREVNGMLYCAPCLSEIVARQQVPAAGAPSNASPGLAATIGAVPGLGAVYNGQYIKALIHVVIFAMLVAIESSAHGNAVETFFGLMIPTFIVYMMVDAYRCAKARQSGQPMPDIIAGSGTSSASASGASPNARIVGPMILIGVGFIFLLHNFDMIDLDRVIERWWPMILILAGGFMAWRQVNARRS